MARFYAADKQKTYGRSHGNRNAKKGKDTRATVGDVFSFTFGATNSGFETWFSATNSDPIADIKSMMPKAETKPDSFDLKIGDGSVMYEPLKLPGNRVHWKHQVSVKPLQFQVRGVSVIRYGHSAIVQVDFTVPDRVTGAPLQLSYYHPILDNDIQEYVAEEVGNAIRNAFDHEIREMLYLGQERFRDPHPEVKLMAVKVTQTAG